MGKTTINVFLEDLPDMYLFKALFGARNMAEVINGLLKRVPREFNIDDLDKAVRSGHKYSGASMAKSVKVECEKLMAFLNEKKRTEPIDVIATIDSDISRLYEIIKLCDFKIKYEGARAFGSKKGSE